MVQIYEVVNLRAPQPIVALSGIKDFVLLFESDYKRYSNSVLRNCAIFALTNIS